MKKNICILTVAFLIPHSVWAATLLGCQESSSKYIACKPGYYLENSTCKECPNIANNKGTSADKNDGGITDCYLTPGTYEDESGTFKIPENNNCYYTTGS